MIFDWVPNTALIMVTHTETLNLVISKLQKLPAKFKNDKASKKKRNLCHFK